MLSINENAVKKFKEIHPYIKKVFTKFDNAGCYHNLHSPEALYQICGRYDIELLRYNYNEPCKGKDQCDREIAAAKTIIRSYLDAGNDLMNAEDIYNGLHYGFGVQDAMVCVIEVDTSAATLVGPKVPSFTSYHSISFTRESMRLWHYFGVGEGIFQPFPGV